MGNAFEIIDFERLCSIKDFDLGKYWPACVAVLRRGTGNTCYLVNPH